MRRAHTTLLALLLAPALFTASADAGTTPGCKPPGSTTILANKTTRVFKWHRLAYACLRRRGVARALTEDNGYGSSKLEQVTPLIAGPFVAWAYRWTGAAEGGGHGIAVRDLRRGGEKRYVEFDQTESDEPYNDVLGKLVLTRRGSIAWSWTLTNIDVKGVETEAREVRKLEAGGSYGRDGLGAMVDSGPDLDLSSLRHITGAIAWTNGTEQRSAPLR